MHGHVSALSSYELVWGRSSVGRAPALHAGGQEFDPPRLHRIWVGIIDLSSFTLYSGKTTR